MLDADVYEAIKQKVGARKIAAYISQITRPQVVQVDLEDRYRAMAADKERGGEAGEWAEGTNERIEGENNWLLGLKMREMA